jgi:serine/threonine protein kinase
MGGAVGCIFLGKRGVLPVSDDALPDTLSAGSGRPVRADVTDTLRTLGDYAILGKLGEGGMGTVFRARQQSLNREVALKVLVGGSFASEDAKERFRRESHVVAALDHPCIVPIYEAGERDGLGFMSMKLMRGGTMAERAAAYRGNPRLAAEHLARIAEAVQHAHSRGVLHRDLKPANVLFDEAGTPSVADFGLAKLAGESMSGRLTQSGALVGSIPYMSPEQASGEPIGPATDIFSLGVMLYEALTGKLPFHADSPLAALRATIEQEPIRPGQHVSGLHRDLEAICLKCLEKAPGRRYATAEALERDLKRWLAGEPVRARVRRGWTLHDRSLLLLTLTALLIPVLWLADGYLRLHEYVRLTNVPWWVGRAWLPLAFIVWLAGIVPLAIIGGRLIPSRLWKDYPVIATILALPWLVFGAFVVALLMVFAMALLFRQGVS